MADIAAGMYAFSGILTALYVRATTGAVCAVDTSLFDALGEWMGAPAHFTDRLLAPHGQAERGGDFNDAPPF